MSELRLFAETEYARPGVAAALLHLQDAAGADVNLLLAGAWVARRGRRLDQAAVAALVALCQEWREQVLQPQRRSRRALKRLAPELYPQALELELALERWQLDRMAEWLAVWLAQTAAAELSQAAVVAELLEENLALALEVRGASPLRWAGEVRQLAALIGSYGPPGAE